MHTDQRVRAATPRSVRCACGRGPAPRALHSCLASRVAARPISARRPHAHSVLRRTRDHRACACLISIAEGRVGRRSRPGTPARALFTWSVATRSLACRRAAPRHCARSRLRCRAVRRRRPYGDAILPLRRDVPRSPSVLLRHERAAARQQVCAAASAGHRAPGARAPWPQSQSPMAFACWGGASCIRGNMLCPAHRPRSLLMRLSRTQGGLRGRQVRPERGEGPVPRAARQVPPRSAPTSGAAVAFTLTRTRPSAPHSRATRPHTAAQYPEVPLHPPIPRISLRFLMSNSSTAAPYREVPSRRPPASVARCQRARRRKGRRPFVLEGRDSGAAEWPAVHKWKWAEYLAKTWPRAVVDFFPCVLALRSSVLAHRRVSFSRAAIAHPFLVPLCRSPAAPSPLRSALT
jgi:hypothetical protein